MRTDGHLPLRDYAVVGDGRTSALVGDPAELGRGPFLYRFSGAEEIEGAFLTCALHLAYGAIVGFFAAL